MKNLAIIPARGGSKRIPHKNIKKFLGKPIIAYSIEAAKKSGLFDEVMVSTDDNEIAEVAKQYGAKVPFMRSNKNSDDFSTLAEVIIEVAKKYEETGGKYDNICCLLSTAPFITSRRITEAYNKLREGSLDSVCPVVVFSYPVLRALEFGNDKKLRMINPEYLNSRSQDLKPAYHDCGSFYWVKTEALKKEKTLLCKNGSAIILPETEVQDIDTKTDWELAEIKYNFLNELKFPNC